MTTRLVRFPASTAAAARGDARREPLSRVRGTSLYALVRDELRKDIAAQPPGAMIPTESELEHRFQVSRITVRKAIEELVSEGLLVRRQGKGTFVQEPKLAHELDMVSSWTDQLRNLGYQPRTTHLQTERIPAGKALADEMGLEESALLLKLRRVRLAGREPISLMTNYIPERLAPDFPKRWGRESLYQLLSERYGLQPAVASDIVHTRAASAEEAHTLQIKSGAPVLCVRRRSFLDLAATECLEIASVVSRGDRYQYHVQLHGAGTFTPGGR